MRTAARPVGEPSGTTIQPNTIQPNTIQPNTIQPNTIQPNAAVAEAPGAVAELDSADQASAAAGDVTPKQSEESANTSEQPFTVETVKEAIQDVENSESYEAETKAEHLKFLQQALKWLESAQEATTRITQLQAEIEGVPGKMAELDERLAETPGPPVPAHAVDATIPQLEQALSQAETSLASAKEKLAEHEKLAESQGRADRKAELAKQSSKANEQLEELEKKLQAAKSDENSELSDSEIVELKAKQFALTRTVALNECQKAWLEANAEVFPKQRDLSQRTEGQQQKLVTAWQEVIAQYRTAESERQAAEARRKVSESHPALRQFAERNAALAEERTDLAGRLDASRNYLESVKKSLEQLQQEFEDLTDRVEVAGMTPTVGLMLRNHRGWLPDPDKFQTRREQNGVELQRVQMAMFDLQKERDGLGDLEETIEQTTRELSSTTLPDLGADRAEAMVREIMGTRQQYIDKLLGDYEVYHDDLSDLEVKTHEVLVQITEYRAYIDEHVLWIRSAAPLSMASFQEMCGSTLRIVDTKQGFLALPKVVWQLVVLRPMSSFLLLLGLIGLVPLRQWFARRLESVGATEEKSWWATLFQLAGPIILAVPGPLGLCVAVAWLQAHNTSAVAGSLAQAVLATAAAWFIVAMLRGAFCRNGLAQDLFRFDSDSADVVRRQLTVLQSVALPLILPLAWLAANQDPQSSAALERAIFIFIQACVAYLLHRMLRPSSGVLADVLKRLPTAWPSRLVPVWYALGVGFPIAISVLAAIGYYFTAWQLLMRGLQTLGIIAVACTLYAVAIRSRSAVAGFVRRRGDAMAAAEGRLEGSWRSLWGGALSLVVLGALWLTWSDTFSALQILDRVELWSTTATVTHTSQNAAGEVVKQRVPETVPVTLADLGVCIVLLTAAFFAGRTLPALLNVAVLNRLPLDHGARHAIFVICRYIVVIVGSVVALQTVGISWAGVQWLAAAMTVGLGFGLQEIFANLVSGLIILFERPIRIGDLVTVSGTTGKVTRMQIRATTITDFDRRELIVPNKKFITEDVVNWTLSDSISRFVISLGISYSSDPEAAQKLLLEVARRHAMVLDEPAPAAVFTSFGSSTLDLELRAFLPSRDNYPTVQHELNVEIERRFRDAGIEIAFPQQDIHIRSLPANLAVIPPEQPTTATLRDAEDRRAA